MISIIIPVYNAEKHLRRCLDSVLAQTYTDWECILVDDGSTDSSGSICDEYQERFKVQGSFLGKAAEPSVGFKEREASVGFREDRFKVVHKPNGGVSSARNSGLDIASGEWIAFIDSDDYVAPDFLQNFMELPQDVDLLQQGFHSIGAWWERPDIDHIEIKMNDCVVRHPQSVLPFINDMMDNDMHAYIWCKLFSTDIIKRHDISFNEDINYQEDLLFTFDYYKHMTSAANTSKSGYYYIFPQNGKRYGKVNALEVYKHCIEHLLVLPAENSEKEHLKENFLDRLRHYFLKPESFSGLTDFCAFFFWFGKTFSRKCLHKVLGNLKQEKLVKALYWGNPILSTIAFSFAFVIVNIGRVIHK